MVCISLLRSFKHMIRIQPEEMKPLALKSTSLQPSASVHPSSSAAPVAIPVAAAAIAVPVAVAVAARPSAVLVAPLVPLAAITVAVTTLVL